VARDLHCKPPDNPVYMGVRTDACVAWHSATEPLKDGESLGWRLVELIVWTADLPLSAAADTVLLPLTTYVSVMRARDASARENSAPAARPAGPATGQDGPAPP
jgi:hypothetical protein